MAQERLEAVYRQEGPRLWRALIAFSGDPDLASDSVSEAFTQALARGDGLRDPAAWIWSVAFRVAKGALNDRRRSVDHAPEGSYDLPETLTDVIAALGALSPNQRLAVVLHDYADRPTDEIARLLGSSRATVHVHLSQGRRRLRRILEADDA